MRRGLRLLAVAAFVLAAGPIASAHAASPTLTGEFLTSTTPATITGSDTGCNRQGNTTFTFEISGIAAGPYPGTFTETGRVTIGPQTEEFLPGQFRGPVVAFEADFVITSPLGTVEGTKRLVANPANVGGCLGDPTALVAAQTLASVLTYEATITTSTGMYEDQGATWANFNAYTFPRAPSTCCYEFRQAFVSSPPQPEPVVAVVTLTPPTATNTVGTDHTVTATAMTATGEPVPSTTIYFTVTGASTAGGSCTTGSDGTCTFTYTGPDFPGADAITACADADDSGAAETGEPCGEATKIWVLPATTPGQVTGGGWIELGIDRVSFGFTVKSDGDDVKGNCNVIDHRTQTHIKCLTVDTVVVAGTHATFFGQASVDGAITNYRIDVDDLGEPGTADTFKIVTDSGYTAAGLVKGNIQIHQ